MDEETIRQKVDAITHWWFRGQLVEMAYEISLVYASGNYSYISEVMERFKKRISE
jgi:hypothetical protein